MHLSTALYRLPHHRTINYMATREAAVLSSWELLGTGRSFVIAPFHQSSEDPAIIIIPEDERSFPSVEDFEKTADTLPIGLYGSTDVPPTEKDSYDIAFENFTRKLRDTSTAKLVLARSASWPRHPQSPSHTPQALFARACRLFPRLFIALVSTPQTGTWLMATPEVLIEGQQGLWRSMALAGTMRLDKSQMQFDTPGGEEIHPAWSDKNIREQRYVATYIRDILDHMATDITETGPFTRRAADLVHLCSEFSFRLPTNSPECIGRLISTLHPTPAVCGMPCEDALSHILAHEPTRRRYYSGFSGIIDPDRDTHLFVTLRCMSIHRDHFTLYAGGGILPESRPEEEWKETEDKMASMRQVIQSVP